MANRLRALVTGAAGFIGSHLCESLVAAGHEVHGIDALTDYYSEQKARNVAAIQLAGARFSQLDLSRDPLNDLVKEQEYIYHLAAQPGLAATVGTGDYLRNNVEATARLVDACRGARSLRCFVNASTSSVYGRIAIAAESEAPEPVSLYGVSKLSAEQLVLAAHRAGELPACSLRLFSVYGPRERPDKVIPQALSSLFLGSEFRLFEGSLQHRRSFTFVGDVVNAMLAVIDHGVRCLGEVLNIGSMDSVSIAQVLRTVEEVTEKKLRPVPAPARRGDQQETKAAVARAKAILGFAPATSLRKGVEEELLWFRGTLEQ